MRAASVGVVVVVVVTMAALAGCASAPARPQGPRLSEIRPPARTSVDVLLSKTVDLELSSEQVAGLVKLQAELNEKVKAIKEEMAAVRAGAAPPAPPPGASAPAPQLPPTNPDPYVGPGRWVGAVRDSGDVGMPRAPRPREAALPPDYLERRTRLEALMKRYDETDAAAYAQAEALLSPPQRAAAKQLMEAHARQRLYPAAQ